MKKVWICYYEYDGWDSCSHPVYAYNNEVDALKWKEEQGPDTEKAWSRVQEMEIGRSYFPR